MSTVVCVCKVRVMCMVLLAMSVRGVIIDYVVGRRRFRRKDYTFAICYSA